MSGMSFIKQALEQDKHGSIVDRIFVAVEHELFECDTESQVKKAVGDFFQNPRNFISLVSEYEPSAQRTYKILKDVYAGKSVRLTQEELNNKTLAAGIAKLREVQPGRLKRGLLQVYPTVMKVAPYLAMAAAVFALPAVHTTLFPIQSVDTNVTNTSALLPRTCPMPPVISAMAPNVTNIPTATPTPSLPPLSSICGGRFSKSSASQSTTCPAPTVPSFSKKVRGSLELEKFLSGECPAPGIVRPALSAISEKERKSRELAAFLSGECPLSPPPRVLMPTLPAPEPCNDEAVLRPMNGPQKEPLCRICYPAGAQRKKEKDLLNGRGHWLATAATVTIAYNWRHAVNVVGKTLQTAGTMTMGATRLLLKGVVGTAKLSYKVGSIFCRSRRQPPQVVA